MATTSTPEQIEKELSKNDKAIVAKTESQKAQGKDFQLDPYGPGVVPERQWQKQKKAAQ